jgi:putative transposase
MEFARRLFIIFYNRGNQSQTIFPQKRNYDFFLKKAKKELCPFVDIIAYCLMPNHFHFLIHTHEIFESRELSGGVRILLSSFTRAIQKQEGFYWLFISTEL